MKQALSEYNEENLTKAEAHDYEAARAVLENSIPYLNPELLSWILSESRQRKDFRMMAALAYWYYDPAGDIPKYLELTEEAAGLGNEAAYFWLASDYRDGKIVPRDYEKALRYFLKAIELGSADAYAAIDVSEDEGEISIASLDTVCFELSWWLFLLEKRPTAQLKCALADWYWEPNTYCSWPTKGQADKQYALKLFEESAKEGCEHAMCRLVMCYAEGECEDHEKAVSWYYFAEERGVLCVELFAARLGIESKRIRDLKPRVEAGDLMAAAELALAYLHGDGCPIDMEKACDCAFRTIGDDESFDRFLAEINERRNSDDAEIMKRINAEANRMGL